MFRVIPRNFGLCLRRAPCLSNGPAVVDSWNSRQSASVSTHPPVRINTPLDNITHQPVNMTYHDVDLALAAWDRHHMNASEVAVSVKYMAQQQYQRLVSNIPWLQTNTHKAYVQLVLKDNLTEAMEPILRDENIHQICKLVEDNVTTFSKKEAVETLLSLLYVGYDNTTPVIHKLLARCKADIRGYDMQCLSVISFIFKALKRNDKSMVRDILSRHKELLKPGMSAANPDVIYAHCILTVNLGMYHSCQLWENCVDYLLDSITHSLPQSACSAEMIATIIQTGSYLWKSGFSPYPLVPRQILFHACKLAENSAAQLQPLHLKQISKSLRLARCLNIKTARLLDNRSKQIVDKYGSDLQVSDISNLISMLRRSSDKHLLRKMEGLLFNKLKDQEVDIVTLSNIAEALVIVNTKNSDLLWLVQERIIKNADSIVAQFSRYSIIVRFLLRKEFINPEHKEVLADILMKSLFTGQNGLGIQSLSITMAYLLPNSTEPIPEQLYLKLVASIPSWSERPVQKLLQALGTLQPKQHMLSMELRRQISQVYRVLYINIVARIDEISNYRELYAMTQLLLIHNKQKDPQLMQKLLHMQHTFTSTLNEVSLLDMLQCSGNNRYFSAALCDSFCKFAVSHPALPTTTLCNLLAYLAMVGYEPQNVNEFLPVVYRTMETMNDEDELYNFLFILSNLMVLEQCPEQILRKVFTMEFLQRVDAFISENPDKQIDMEKLMTEVNRCTVIEYPQLDVPWFSEKYCREHTVKVNQENSRSASSRLRWGIETVLQQIIGQDTYKRWTFSPYYHVMSFECIVDKKNQVLKWSDALTIPSGEYQRIALLVHPERHYCFTDGGPARLLGYQSLMQRQLQILGYKVKQIPHFEWNSMALADEKAKKEYIRKKLFK